MPNQNELSSGKPWSLLYSTKRHCSIQSKSSHITVGNPGTSTGENASPCFSMSMLSCKFMNFVTYMRKHDCCILHNWAPKSHLLSSSDFLNEIIFWKFMTICKMIHSNDNIKKESVKETCSSFCELPLRFILLYLIKLPWGVCISPVPSLKPHCLRFTGPAQHEK